MQDSLEDFIKISSKSKIFNETATISKEELITAERKKQCENYAQQIVELLIDGKLHTKIFLRCLNFINPDHYQDIVEERAVTNLCGYALCGKNIPLMPNKQFHISTKVNKVYDITDRKNFCSNYCYQASCFIKKQVDSKPLWLRDSQNIQKIELFEGKTVLEPGVEVDYAFAKDVEPAFTSVANFAEACLDEADENELSNNTEHREYKKEAKRTNKLLPIDEEEAENQAMPSTSNDGKMNSILDNVRKDEEAYKKKKKVHFDEDKLQQIVNKVKSKTNNENKIILIESEDENQVIEKYAEKLVDKMKLSDVDSNMKAVIKKVKNMEISKKPKDPNSDKMKAVLEKLKNKGNSEKKVILLETVVNPEQIKTIKEENNKKEFELEANQLEIIKNAIFKWITIETLIFLHGEEQVKSILDENALINHFEKLKISKLETEQQLRYIEICKGLQMRELAEEKFDNVTLGKQYKQLPNFHELKEESKDLNIKVKAFYSGVLYEKEDSNFPQKKDASNEPEQPAVLPLIDNSSQHALRMKIFINSITKYIKKHIKELNVDERVFDDTLAMTKTFKLDANNVAFKPATWNFLSFVLINILSIRDESLRTQLKIEPATTYKNTIINKSQDYLNLFDNLLKYVENVDEYVEKYITTQ